MRKENGKRESPYKGILKFADEKKPQLSFAVVLSVLSSAFGIVPYIAVAILLQKALASSLTTTWAILLPVIALCGYLLKHTLYAKSTLCSHKVAYEIIKNIRTTIMKKMSKVSMGTIQGKSSGEFKQLVIDDAERLEGPLAHAIPEMTASILVPIFVILYLLVIDWRMALAALVSAILGNLIYYGMMFGRGEVMKEYMMSNANMNATIVEYVNGMEVIKAFNQTASSMGRFQSAVLKVRDITTKWYKHCWPFMSTTPYYGVLNDLAMCNPMGIVSPNAFNEDLTTKEELLTQTMGTGPYMYAGDGDGTSYTFVRNPNYWGEKPDVDEFTSLPYCDVEATTYSYNADKAKELLESAGWVDSDGDGIREKDGAKLSVTLDYITNQGTMDDAALVIAQELGEVGFEVTPRGSDNMTWFTQVSTDFDFSLHTTYGGYYDPFLTMTNMNPEMMSDPILWQVALTMENGTDTIKELDSTADLDRVQEIYSEVLTFAADQAVLVPFTSAHQYAAFNSDKIDSFSFGSDQLFIEIANVKAK